MTTTLSNMSPTAQQFVNNLITIDEDCYLSIASYWSPIDLHNLQQTFPQLTRRVQLAFDNVKRALITADYLRDMQPLFRATELKLILFEDLALVDKLPSTFAQQLAASCPNVERFSYCDRSVIDWHFSDIVRRKPDLTKLNQLIANFKRCLHSE